LSNFPLQLKFQKALNQLICVVTLLWFMGVSCQGEGIHPESNSPEFNGDCVDVCTLTVVDSIGVELGDSNYVFGALDEVGIGPNGDIFAVDWMKCSIFRYSPDGDFIQRIGRPGNGPGEMIQPGHQAIMDDGSICVYDGEQGWIRYNSSGECISSGTMLRPGPMRFQALDSVNILGMLNELSHEDNYFVTDKRICMWNADEPDSIITEYYSREYQLSTDDMMQFRKDIIRVDFFPMLFTAGDGFVCIAPEPRTEPLLLLFHEDGSVMDTLVLPYPEVLRTEEELQIQKQFIEDFFYYTSRYTHQVDWEPFPNKPMIADLGVDSLNRIWVQRGFEQNPTFDLYDVSGEHLITAVLPGRDDTDHWKFNISRRGILAVPEDPESYYSVYMIGAGI